MAEQSADIQRVWIITELAEFSWKVNIYAV